jgi:hypothetical protein
MSNREENFPGGGAPEYEVSGSVMAWLYDSQEYCRYADLAVAQLSSAPIGIRRRFMDEYALYLSDPQNSISQDPPDIQVIDLVKKSLAKLECPNSDDYRQAWIEAAIYQPHHENYLLEGWDITGSTLPAKTSELSVYGFSWS